jgi:hypothetical protein
MVQTLGRAEPTPGPLSAALDEALAAAGLRRFRPNIGEDISGANRDLLTSIKILSAEVPGGDNPFIGKILSDGLVDADGQIVAEALVTASPTKAAAAAAPAAAAPVAAAPLGPKWQKLPDEPMLKAKLDGYIPADAKPSQIFSTRVDQVDNIADVFGTPEHLTQVIVDRGSPDFFNPDHPINNDSLLRKAWETGKNPIPFKQRQAALLKIEILRREFPSLIRAAGVDGFEQVMKEAGVAERDWLPHLLEDRVLATKFANSGAQSDFEALIAHAGGVEQQGKYDALYASEEWQAITGLFALADKTASDEAFRVHFFNPYRSAFERSINHPLLGVYPVSWAYKAAREWVRFLYENRTFNGLRLGMAPAVAMNSIVRAQNVAFAQSNPSDLETYIGTTGPFGSAFMIFNLILPGDWSTIPFPMSRTIRDGLRGNLNMQTLERNVTSLGAARDARLLYEMGGEVKDFVWGKDVKTLPNGDPIPWAPHPNVGPYQPSTLDGERAYR